MAARSRCGTANKRLGGGKEGLRLFYPEARLSSGGVGATARAWTEERSSSLGNKHFVLIDQQRQAIQLIIIQQRMGIQRV